MKIKNVYGFGLLFLVLFTLNSCYSFTGSSLNPSIKTINIRQFPNYSTLQNPNLSIEFTNGLQDYFDQRTNLILTNEDADIVLEGEITNYTLTSVAVQSGDVAGRNRLTIRVKVRYQNNTEPDKSFDREFSDYEDFEQNSTLQEVEAELTEAINERIINQIFNAVVADW